MVSIFDKAPDRRDPTRLNKWTWYPSDVIPMWVADMDFRSPPAVLAALHKAVDHGVLVLRVVDDVAADLLQAFLAAHRLEHRLPRLAPLDGVTGGHDDALPCGGGEVRT